jgi:hypothetical protein
MNDGEGFAAGVIVVGTVVFMLFGAGYALTKWALKEPPSPRSAWEQQMRERCNAMRSGLTIENGIARCYRTPFMRQPKLVFEEKAP